MTNPTLSSFTPENPNLTEPVVRLDAIARNVVAWLPKSADWPMTDANGRVVDEPMVIRGLRESAEELVTR